MSTNKTRSTPAKRSADNTVSFGMGALLLFAFSIGLYSDGHTIAGAILFLVTIGIAYVAFRGSYMAACPACGQAMDELSAGNPKRCPNCFRYSVLNQGQFRELDPETTKYGPFTIPMPANPRMPNLCCGCGAPATGVKRVVQTVNMANFTALPPPGSGKSFDLSVPVCSAHDPIVILRAEGTGNPVGLRRIGVFGPQNSPLNPGLFAVMQVPSYRFYWGFIRLNGMTLSDN
jgi:hypothetical protein